MMFGDPSDFAIEALIEPHLVAPSNVWGRICVHIGPVILGDITDEHCGLFGAYCGFKELVTDEPRLWDDSFAGLSFEQIHDLVRNAIYGDDERSMEAIVADAQRYQRFDFLTNWDEPFDGFASVILQQDDTTTTIMHRPHSAWGRTRDPGPFLVASCRTTGFRAACAAFVQWYDEQSERLKASR